MMNNMNTESLNTAQVQRGVQDHRHIQDGKQKAPMFFHPFSILAPLTPQLPSFVLRSRPGWAQPDGPGEFSPLRCSDWISKPATADLEGACNDAVISNFLEVFARHDMLIHTQYSA